MVTYVGAVLVLLFRVLFASMSEIDWGDIGPQRHDVAHDTDPQPVVGQFQVAKLDPPAKPCEFDGVCFSGKPRQSRAAVHIEAVPKQRTYAPHCLAASRMRGKRGLLRSWMGPQVNKALVRVAFKILKECGLAR